MFVHGPGSSSSLSSLVSWNRYRCSCPAISTITMTYSCPYLHITCYICLFPLLQIYPLLSTVITIIIGYPPTTVIIPGYRVISLIVHGIHNDHWLSTYNHNYPWLSSNVPDCPWYPYYHLLSTAIPDVEFNWVNIKLWYGRFRIVPVNAIRCLCVVFWALGVCCVMCEIASKVF